MKHLVFFINGNFYIFACENPSTAAMHLAILIYDTDTKFHKNRFPGNPKILTSAELEKEISRLIHVQD